MSFILQQALNNQEADPEKIKMANIQFDAMNVTFNNILYNCSRKCIPEEYGEAELNKGEMVCIDRCVAKFFKANLKMGAHAQSLGFGPDSLYGYEKVNAWNNNNYNNNR